MNLPIIKAWQLDKKIKYYKLTNREEKHRGMQYKTGMNIDILPFNPTGECSEGGLYFFSETQLIYHDIYCEESAWIREVSFEGIGGIDIYVERDKYKTNKFVLGKRQKFVSNRLERYIRFDNENIITEIKKNTNNIAYIPDKVKDIDMCISAVKKDGMALKYVPKKMKTENICKLAVQHSSFALEYVPDKLKDQDMCAMAVSKNSFALEYVPEHLKTDSLCAIAVRQSGYTLRNVPINCTVTNRQQYIMDERYFDICILAMKNNGESLRYFPFESFYVRKSYEPNMDINEIILNEKRIKKICMTAIVNNGYAIKYVPDKFKTIDMCYMVYKNDMAKHNVYYEYTTCNETNEYIPKNMKEIISIIIQYDILCYMIGLYTNREKV